ncbi:class I SAM-dependent DNA methyltransferase [Fodinicurvata fenggangensis]|uniref:class I SAM-dependent DNA methyltransferase n=1 Tax=Fodinicurvata fenggangensis TaxID=1121830 RepID=UPI00068C6DAF|nr:DNA methyltransferase [Fodinicurvata fenggangensis]
MEGTGKPEDGKTADAQAFIARWQETGGGERSNAQLFLSELCQLLEVAQPQGYAPEADNAYVFERRVRAYQLEDARHQANFIDLYKRDCFVLEAKQGSDASAAGIGRRGTGGWDKGMKAARVQAERYAKALHDADEPWPPFLLIVDVGHLIEVYADFSQSGKTYLPFPDPAAHRIRLQQLAEPDTRAYLKAIWEDPQSLDPTRRAARVTREIADHLAELARSLERDHQPEKVAQFLMRCLFTMFAEDVGLLSEEGFTRLLRDRRDDPKVLQRSLESLWKTMNKGGFDSFLGAEVLVFNGGLFRENTALPLAPGQIDLLLEAAAADWQEVEPAIFGTLLERALNKRERHKLGAHYTPRAYVERLVLPTVVEPLREAWENVRIAAERRLEDGERTKAIEEIKAFHQRLCDTRVLDPACGSANFLYVTLEHMKRLEGEVLNALEELGDDQPDLYAVDPQQFLGLEVNPRAAVIAEMVLWIGYLQWHFRTRARRQLPSPVLKAYGNIECRDAVLDWDGEPELVRDETGRPVERWDGLSMKTHPVTGREVPDESKTRPLYHFRNPRPASWPRADFIVGNPPFIGNWRMRDELGSGYVETLRATYPQVPESVDYVMYWWHKAADLVATGKAQRFGLITTNSLRQKFARQVIAKHMGGKKPLSLAFAIPDHPWVDAADGADVRIAMTVGVPGEHPGQLHKVTAENPAAEEGARALRFDTRQGRIHADLTIGPDVSGTHALKANDGLCCPGVKLHGSGFIVTPEEAEALGLGRRPGLEQHIRPYRNGRDLMGRPREVMVIDLYGLSAREVLARYPEVYQWVSDRLKPTRDGRKGTTSDSDQYAKDWWLFGKTRPELRRALSGLPRYIATVETAKHRVFQFLEAEILPDNMLVNIALEDAFFLGVLSSRIHVVWALSSGGTLEDRPRYNKSRCFDPFPFPDATEAQQDEIRALAERLDAFRKERQAEQPDLSLTQMYNVLEALRAGRALSDSEQAIHEKGLVSVLRDLHDQLDAAVAAAYGWPRELSDEAILERLVALNRTRAEEEARGEIRWLRPAYQNPEGQATRTAARAAELDLGETALAAAGKTAWPKSLPERVQAVRAALATLDRPASTEEVASLFKRARRQDVSALLQTLCELNHLQETEAGYRL